MNHRLRPFFSALSLGMLMVAGLAITSSAHADLGVNGLFENLRVFNDHPTSILTVTNNYPSLAVIDDSGLVGSGANRHDLLASTDGGTSKAVFDIDTSFSMSATVKLEASTNSPRKEAGLRITSPISGDALFIINSDAGEIVAFGGGAPFQIFGSNGGGNGYTPGDEIFMQMIYTASGGGANGVPGQVEYRIDRGNGIESSGLLDWSNIEGGPVDPSIGFYGQFQETGGVATFTNMSIVPEPGVLTLLGLGFLSLVGLIRRR